MKLQVRLLATHAVAAIVGVAGVLLGMSLGGGAGFAVGGGAVLAAIGTASWWSINGLRAGLSVLERSLDSPERALEANLGIRELDRLAERLRELAQHWSQTASRSRLQAQEVEGLLTQMNRRTANTPGSPANALPGRQLRQLLGSLASTATNDIQRILTCADEIERRTQEMAAGAGEQASAVGQTTTAAEQMSSHIDTVSQNAEAAHKAAVAARESAAVGQQLVRDLIRGMDQIRVHVDAAGRKLQALGDRSQEVGSIVETIGAISARTDMLALNASIESVRAGEHGRGFAVVAEEVRKLAEQAAHATREVACLIQSMQVETQEAIAAMADERTQVEEEGRRVNEAGVALETIGRTSYDSAERVGDISRATSHQLRVTQEVVLAMQRISEVAKGIGRRTEGVCRTTKSLTELAHQLDESLTPLRSCTAVAEEPAAVSDWTDESDEAAVVPERRRVRPRPSGPALEGHLAGAGAKEDAR